MKNLLLTLFISLYGILSAQELVQVSPVAGESLPAWAALMYSSQPNVWTVDDGYRIWRQSNPEDKTTYTQYYKKWRRAVEPFLTTKGEIHYPSVEERKAFEDRLDKLKSQSGSRTTANWTVMGPVETFNTNTGPSPLAKSSQANIYCIDQSLSDPNIVFCGTEGAEIFKSTDKGMNWECVSRDYAFNAISALKVDPQNANIVFAGEHNRLWKSTDGGDTWEQVLTDTDMWINDIKINPGQSQIILTATQHGLYRSTDGGSSWTRTIEDTCYDLEWKVNDPAVCFLVSNDPNQEICRFYKSLDYGETWELKSEGWFFSDEEGRHDGGARLAVTDADPNRVYAVLIGEAKTDDSGFIGIWRSDDAGETWTLPNPPAGGPWDATTHPNMATINRTGGYHQGFYNLGFDASDTDADYIMAGFLNLWISIDGGQSYLCHGGYCGNNFNYVHPDCQEIEINGNDLWMTSDGGIEYSDDHFVTHYARNRGITSSDYWGFGTGWNEDVLVGGRYHNGNSGWYENWMPGEVLSLGGGEAPTGYVSPEEGRKTFFSDIGGVVLPESQNGTAKYFSIGKYPNESYYDAESGEMEWDPIHWNTFYVTRENKLWVTHDGGSSFSILYEFGSDINARALSFEICRSNPNVFYLFQRNASSWDPGTLWKSEDGGVTWNTLSLPPGYARRVLLSADAEDENRLWLAYADGGNGEKIYSSQDGGDSWNNLTTSSLDGEHITYVLHQGGTDGGVYIGTFRTIWFKDDQMADWLPYGEGLPKSISTCILRPFYRDGKLRLGAYGKGIWESPFAVPSRPVAQPMVFQRETSCPGDTIRFDDFSMLSHEGATWSWSFPGGNPSSSDLRNPKVTYAEEGYYDVTLTVTNANGTSTKTIQDMIHVLSPVVNTIPPLIDFENEDYFEIVNPDNGITWAPVTLTSCDAEGDIAYVVNNYDYSSYGVDEIVMPVNMDLTQVEEATLFFDVAYAPYYDGNAFIDSLKVLLTNNCGKSFVTLFNSGGEELSTTTSGLGPNNLYEQERFSPQSCDEWRTVALDLTPFAGQYITIKFVNQSGYGNNMHLDNIWIETTLVGTEESSGQMAVQVRPNPSSGVFTFSAREMSHDPILLSIHSSAGKKLLEKTIQSTNTSWQESIDLTSFPSGLYIVKLFGPKGLVYTDKLIKL